MVVGDYEISTLGVGEPRTAHSGDFALPETSPVPTDRRFATFKVGHDRSFDGEVKYLEELSAKIDAAGEGAEGTVALAIDSPKHDICPSCEGVITQFQNRYGYRADGTPKISVKTRVL